MRRTDVNALGLWGEQVANSYLVKRGDTVLETRWKSRFGEIDIIAVSGGYLCFVEVKLRKNKNFAPARSYVTKNKQEKLRLTAELYLMEYPTQLQPRFDVIEIYASNGMQTKQPEIIYWENAF